MSVPDGRALCSASRRAIQSGVLLARGTGLGSIVAWPAEGQFRPRSDRLSARHPHCGLPTPCFPADRIGVTIPGMDCIAKMAQVRWTPKALSLLAVALLIGAGSWTRRASRDKICGNALSGKVVEVFREPSCHCRTACGRCACLGFVGGNLRGAQSQGPAGSLQKEFDKDRRQKPGIHLQTDGF